MRTSGKRGCESNVTWSTDDPFDITLRSLQLYPARQTITSAQTAVTIIVEKVPVFYKTTTRGTLVHDANSPTGWKRMVDTR